MISFLRWGISHSSHSYDYMYGFFEESEQQNVSVASRSPLASSVICSNLWVSDLVQLFNLQQPWVAFEKTAEAFSKMVTLLLTLQISCHCSLYSNDGRTSVKMHSLRVQSKRDLFFRNEIFERYFFLTLAILYKELQTSFFRVHS